jgi:SAM-dependent methyltransferase
MLAIARSRCSSFGSTVEFVETPAAPLALSSETADRVVCQQGFQFFPDKVEAASEIMRILRPGGDVIASTWCSVEQCHWIGQICRALDDIGAVEIDKKMRVPFDHMPEAELTKAFSQVGFENIRVSIRQRPLVFPGGIEEAIKKSYSTPIGPDVQLLSEDQQDTYRRRLAHYLNAIQMDNNTLGQMTSLILTASKPGRKL